MKKEKKCLTSDANKYEILYILVFSEVAWKPGTAPCSGAVWTHSLIHVFSERPGCVSSRHRTVEVPHPKGIDLRTLIRPQSLGACRTLSTKR